MVTQYGPLYGMEISDDKREKRISKAKELQHTWKMMDGLEEGRNFLEDSVSMPPPKPRKLDLWIQDVGKRGHNPNKACIDMEVEDQSQLEIETVHMGKRRRNGGKRYILKEQKKLKKRKESKKKGRLCDRKSHGKLVET